MSDPREALSSHTLDIFRGVDPHVLDAASQDQLEGISIISREAVNINPQLALRALTKAKEKLEGHTSADQAYLDGLDDGINATTKIQRLREELGSLDALAADVASTSAVGESQQIDTEKTKRLLVRFANRQSLLENRSMPESLSEITRVYALLKQADWADHFEEMLENYLVENPHPDDELITQSDKKAVEVLQDSANRSERKKPRRPKRWFATKVAFLALGSAIAGRRSSLGDGV